MKIRLQRKIQISCYEVEMIIATSQRREDLLPILELAKEEGYLTGNIIREILFQDLPRRFTHEIINNLLYLKLVKEQTSNYSDNFYILTESGQKAIENREVFTPEEGIYRIWFADDVLLGDKNILRVKPIKEDYPNFRGQKNKETITIPKRLEDKCGKIWQTLSSESYFTKIRIDDIKPKGRKIGFPRDTLEIQWEIEEKKHSLKVIGTIDEKEINKSLHTEFLEAYTQEKALYDIFSSPEYDWQDKRQKLLVSFQNISNFPDVIKGFQQNINLKNIYLHNWDIFSQVDLSEIPINAKTLKDAQEWSQYLLRQEASQEYLTSAIYSKLWKKIACKFDEYQDSLEFPPQEKIAEQIYQENFKINLPRTYWHLQAPLDLKL